MTTDDSNGSGDSDGGPDDSPDSAGAAPEKEKRIPSWYGWLAAGALALMLFLVLYTLQEYKTAWAPAARANAQTR